MITKIFLDFDNTLASSLYASDEKHADQLFDMHTEYFVGDKFELSDGWYVTFRRPCAIKLIEFCNDLVGRSNVYILTYSKLEYIQKCNEILKLGFDPKTNIFSREDLEKYSFAFPCPDFIDTKNILVDDIPHWEHRRNSNNKLYFLNRLPPEQFVEIDVFDVMYTFDEDEKNVFEKVSTKILEIVK